MYKIFSVKNDSAAENTAVSLVHLGINYLPTFERELGILNFCSDLEVITDGFINKQLYIIVDGFTTNQVFQNNDLQEITIDELKASVKKAFSVKGAGTNRILNELGYQTDPYNSNGNKNLSPFRISA